MSPETAAVFAAIIGVMLVLAKIIDRLIFKKKDSGSSAPCMGLVKETREMVKTLHAIHGDDEILSKVRDMHAAHARTDEDGTPLWYVPRSLQHTLDSVATAVRDLHETARKTCRVQEQILAQLKNGKR